MIIPKGQQCQATVYDSHSMWGGRSCLKKAKVCVNGKFYCGVHDPIAVKKRRDESTARYEAELKRKQEQREAPYKCIAALKAENKRLREAIENFLELHCHEGWCDECSLSLGSELYTRLFEKDLPEHEPGCKTAQLQAALKE